MKKIIWSITYFIFLNTFAGFAQKISKDFIDGEVYIKIKKDVYFKFDTQRATVDINTKLSFLLPLKEKYAIVQAEASFYFSKSDKLQRTFRIHFKKSVMVDALIADLKAVKQIEYVEKIPLMHLDYTPNDLQANNNTGQYALFNVHAREAWDVSRGTFQIRVAVVDNAMDIDHQDLSSNVFDSWDVSDNDNNPRPPNSGAPWFHGTHTSGIACAVSDNNTGIASIGFNNSLIAVKATRNNSSVPTSIDHGYEGIAWAASHGANVISCSWGNGTFTQTGQNTIDDAFNRGAIVVASAGNNNNNIIQFPAGYNHVVAVASVDINDQRAGTSSFGNWVDVAAPGVSINSTIPAAPWYGLMWGTSMAAPLVAGLCGLIKSINPGLSYDQVVGYVISTAENIDAQNPGFNGQLGSGRINAFQAVEHALPCNPSISLPLAPYDIPKTESSGTITSASLIADVQVIFDATTLVDLVPGFFVANGRTLHAYIDGCGNFASARYTKSKKANSINEKVADKENNALSVNTLQAFPNPASSIVHLSFNLKNDENKISLQVFDMKMRKVKEINISKLTAGKRTIPLSLTDLSSGMYIVVLKLNSEQLTTKVVLAR